MNLFLWPVISFSLAPTLRLPNSGTISLVCGGVNILCWSFFQVSDTVLPVLFAATCPSTMAKNASSSSSLTLPG